MMFIESILVYYKLVARRAGLGAEVSGQAMSLSPRCPALGVFVGTLLADGDDADRSRSIAAAVLAGMAGFSAAASAQASPR